MQLFIGFLLACGALFQAVFAVPVSYYTFNSHADYPRMYPRYAYGLCAQQGYLCGHGIRARYIPYTINQPAAQMPVMKQSFTTTTRNHNSLNMAKVNSMKSAHIKYQDGPSMKVEGMQGASMYNKHYGEEMPFDPMVNDEMFDSMPMQ